MYGDAAVYGLLALLALAVFAVGTRLDRAWLAVTGMFAACTCAALAVISVAGIWLGAAAQSMMQ